MIDSIEFNDVKQVRKTLLIASFVGICFKSLVKNSTETIEFFGFKIPIENSSIIPNLIGCLVIYFLFALFIRYMDETFQSQVKKYRERIKNLENDIKSKENLHSNESLSKYFIDYDMQLRKAFRKSRFSSYAIIFLDFIFPICFGVFSLIVIFR